MVIQITLISEIGRKQKTGKDGEKCRIIAMYTGSSDGF